MQLGPQGGRGGCKGNNTLSALLILKTEIVVRNRKPGCVLHYVTSMQHRQVARFITELSTPDQRKGKLGEET